MLIGIDASRANQPHRSGTEWYSFNLIRELAKIDAENQYVLYTNKPLRPDLADLTDQPAESHVSKIDRDGYQAIRSPHNNFKAKVLSWPFSFFWTQGRLSLEMALSAPDVLFVPAHTLPVIHPRRSVVTVHDVGFERERKIYDRKPIGPLNKRSRRLLDAAVRFLSRGRYGANSLDYLSWSTLYGLKKARRVLTVSEFSRSEIVDVYKHDVKPHIFEKIRVVHNGIDPALFNDNTDRDKGSKVLAKYGLTKPYLFYVGRIERKKNIPTLIEAFGLAKNRLDGMKLVLTGAASYGYDEVQYLVSEYGLDDRVIKTGWVEEVDLPHIFANARAFVFPSVYEGFGIPLIEAMACNVPVVCSNAPAIREVVGDAALYFDPQDKRAMADALVAITTDEELRSRNCLAGLARAKQFSWQKAARETLAVLQE